MNASPIALIIDDELQIRRLLRVALEAAGYTVQECASGQEGLQSVAFRRPDVVLLDLGLPDLDGHEVLRRLREWSEVPVVVLTVRDSEGEKVKVLDGGADDYVTKPFSTPELLARLRSAQRRTRTTVELPVFTAGNLVVDLVARTVLLAGEEVHLTATEYSLLRLFIRHAGRVLTHQHILREVWGPKAEEQRQYLRVHIGNLRKKISPNGPDTVIRTEPGIGYRFLVDIV
jgi:two-component system KDP operon response regulator KdpE